MKYLHILLLLLLHTFGYSQSDAAKVQYREMIMDGKHLYALSAKGELAVWDIGSFKKLYQIQDTMFSAIAKDRNNSIHIGTKDGRLARINTESFGLDWYSQLKKKVHIHNIFFNSKNKMFLTVPYCVYDPLNDKKWNKFKIIRTAGMSVSVVKKFLFFTYLRPAKYHFMLPKYAFTDSSDRIWMANSFGEFGTALNVFDANKEAELDPDIFENYGLLHLQSVFEDNKNNVFITSGLQHLGYSGGNIYKIINDKAVTIFDSDDYSPKTPEGGLYIGPGAYSAKEQKVYFAAENGIYRAVVPVVGKITEIEKVVAPELQSNRENLAIGMQMAIKKMEFTPDNKLVFLTANNGIGIFNGKDVMMLE